MAAVLTLLSIAVPVLGGVLWWVIRIETRIAAMQRDIHWVVIGFEEVGLIKTQSGRKK